ncbi:MAG: hypothetical protein ACD_22C00222G0003 [uncultured bacterium]|nr:MAG: hypothetical protein ACD_22C00222G0003 [uncultured bacterium]
MLSQLNSYALEMIRRYQKLNIYNQKVNTPYHINNVGNNVIKKLLKDGGVPDEQAKNIYQMYKDRKAPFGWYRGKGTPEEIEQSVIELANLGKIDIDGATSVGIEEFMKLFGLGVDCSGFVFNTLSYAFEKIGKKEEFVNSLAWPEDKKTVFYAGAHVFAGDNHSVIQPPELQALDIVLKHIDTNYYHIAMIVEDNGEMYLAQSDIDCYPSGINLSKIDKTKGNAPFTYESTFGQDWNLQLQEGIIECRRLPSSLLE